MSGSLNIIDLLFIAIFFFSIVFGLIRGLLRELLAVAVLVAALVVAFVYYPDMGLLLSGIIKKRELAELAGFLFLLLVVGGAGSLLSRLIGKLLAGGPLKGLDRLLGGVFGVLRALLLSGIVIYAFIAFPLNEELLRKSQLAPYLVSAMKTGIRLLPPAWRDKLRSIKLYDYQKNNRDRRTV
jgi:membrane protein required for colicin V production